MRARNHAILGAAAAAATIPAFGPYSAVFWAASVAIDGDHYLDYLCRNRFTDFSARKMFEFHRRLYAVARERNFLGLNLFHTVEFISMAGALAYTADWTWLIAAFWGMLFHLVTDLIYLAIQRRLTKRSISVIEYAVRWKRMQWLGLKPERPYETTLQAMSVTPPGGTKG